MRMKPSEPTEHTAGNFMVSRQEKKFRAMTAVYLLVEQRYHNSATETILHKVDR